MMPGGVARVGGVDGGEVLDLVPVAGSIATGEIAGTCRYLVADRMDITGPR